VVGGIKQRAVVVVVGGEPSPQATDAACWAVGPVTRCVTRERGSMREGEGLMFYSNRRLAGPLVRNEKAGACSTTIRRRRGYSRHRGLSYDTKTTEAS
jgi:hypothetical protein